MNPNKGKDQMMFRTIVGSHIWNMHKPDSDVDTSMCYIINSKDLLVKGPPTRGKCTHNVPDEQGTLIDEQIYELGKVISLLKKCNPNMLWLVLSPIKQDEWKNCLKELKQITVLNLSKQVYYAINGMCENNLRDFIIKGDRKSLKYKKKLDKIGRVLQFGINLLLYGKPIFAPIDVKEMSELNTLKIQLNEAFKVSTLPEKSDPKPFDDYLLKWRLKKLQIDEMI